jgi:hypothetical protein
MYLKRQYDMGLRLPMKIKFQTGTLPFNYYRKAYICVNETFS